MKNLSLIEYKDFFVALRHSLWNNNSIISNDAMLDNIYQKAREQAITGIIFSGVCDVIQGRASKKQILNWYSKSEQIKKKNEIINRHLDLLARLMEQNNINYKVVKGQVVASCYPEPLLRNPGDIDFWVDQDSQKACEEVFQKILKADYHWEGSEKHVEYQFKGVLYELHSSLTTFTVGSRQKYFDSIVEQDKGMYVKVGETQVATLSPTLNALYIFIHLFQHLIHSGVGLRQMCDWMMWLHKYQDEIDRDELEKHLRMLALLKPYRVLGAILVDDLGLPETEFPFDITKKDRKRSRKVLRDIMELGNFGHNKENIKKLGFLHSLQTGVRMCKQGAKYVDLAPQEILCRVPHTVLWYVKKKL